MKLLKRLLLLTLFAPLIQVSQGQTSKFLGNIMGTYVPSTFGTYWKQVSPENAGKWGSVEATRDVMSWGNLDLIYNYANSNNIPVKEHTLVWGNQEPTWLNSLSDADQLTEVVQWFTLLAQRYPGFDMIDVVNEPLHNPPSYKNAIGGNGTTGWDWVIWSFQKARQLWPNAKLLLNDYAILNTPRNLDNYLIIINLLKDRGLIDGIGVQGHGLERTDPATISSSLAKLVATGIPVYVTELDVNVKSDNTQLSDYQTLFPLFWDNPNVAGVTLWGYIQGETWQNNAYLLRSDGTERPALTWLMNYVGNGGQQQNGTISRVESIVKSSAHASKGASYAVASVTITDEFNKPIQGATVSGTFYGDFNESGSAVTDASGVANVQSSGSKKGTLNFDFCVDNVSASLPYDTTQNVVTCTNAALKSSEVANSPVSEFDFYPNPAHDMIHIEFNPGNITSFKVSVFDLTGRKVMTSVLSGQQGKNDYQINVGVLAEGTYLITVCNDQETWSKKLLIR